MHRAVRDPGDLVAVGPEGADGERRDMRIGQIAHRALAALGGREGAGLFSGEPGGVFGSPPEILGFQLGAGVENVGGGHPTRDLLHQEGHRDAQTANGRLPLADIGIHGDARGRRGTGYAIREPRMPNAERPSVSRVLEKGTHGLTGGTWNRPR